MKEKFYILTFILFYSNLIFGQKAKLNISIDDRIETLYSVAYFDNYFLVNKHANIYKNSDDALLIDDGIIQAIDSSENILTPPK